MFPIKGNTRPVSAGAGFTLLELLVGMSLSFTIVVASLAAFTYVSRNLTRMSNTQRLEALSRRTFAILNKDVHQAVQIDTAHSSSTKLVLFLPVGGQTAVTRTVTYLYTVPAGTDANRGILTRTVSQVVDPEDYNTTLLTGIDTTATPALRFNYLDTSGNATPMISAKEVELVFNSSYKSDKIGATNILKSSKFTAVSSRVALSNRNLLQ